MNATINSNSEVIFIYGMGGHVGIMSYPKLFVFSYSEVRNPYVSDQHSFGARTEAFLFPIETRLVRNGTRLGPSPVTGLYMTPFMHYLRPPS